MLVLRIVALLAVIAIGASVLAWLLSGNRKYLRFAWRVFQLALAGILVFLALLFFERLHFIG